MQRDEVREPAPRILIVDDHEDNVELLRARLESWGYRTDSVTDGEQALAAVAANPPDLILLDVMMPRIDGIEVARRIKASESLPFIPIIMQTALDSTESKVEGLGAGADDYITKPIEFAELGARVKSMLRIKRLQEALEERERELRQLNDRLLHTSRTDALTGLDNRRHLEERLEEMFGHARRLNEPLSCVMCDLDKFKSVNDTYGHQAGDRVLEQFAGLLRAAVREVDRAGRYGGEEFMLLLPGTVPDAAMTFAERVRKAVAEHTFTFDGGTLRRTASFGVAGWPFPDVADADGLVKAADDALYVAKGMGRNRVVRFGGEEFKAHRQLIADEAPRTADHGPSRDSDVTERGVPREGRGDRGAAGEGVGAPAGA
ncbi:MAG TPA: diguanylate cyclase [Gemmatimonadaceae bacterium]|nr:diguanylate cyclase [Gemmatimonadaceae bacterium]